MSHSLTKFLADSLTTIKRANWYRQEKQIIGVSGALIHTDTQTLVNFASNDYLSLANDNRLKQSAIDAVQQYGTGSTGSRLLSGHRKLHEQLESAIAQWKGAEKALVFSSGYSANVGIISSLVKQKDLILEDKYNHSSLKNGAKLSQAHSIAYNHGDIADLDRKLQENRHQYRHCLIITDSVFSMDGDLCPLPELVEIARKYDCWLLIDEAHGTGVMGKTGAGCIEHFNIKNHNIIQVGTLSKALGSLGGYVAGSELLIDFLRNRCPTWIYTTALSPADTVAALTAIEIIQNEPERREKLWQNIQTLRSLLEQLSLDFFTSESAIICLKCNNPIQALNLSEKLAKEGFFIPAIRPPTVSSSRLRFSVMTSHEMEHFVKLYQFLESYN